MAAIETCEKEKLLSYIVTVAQRTNCVKPLSRTSESRQINKLTSVFHACVLSVIDHESRHNIVKVAVGSRGDSKFSNCQLSLVAARHK